MSVEHAREDEHDFALILGGVGGLTPAVMDALFAAGCDDATLSVQYGCVFAEFARKAPSLKDAILSAIRDVRKAGVGADVLRVDRCDLVSQADVARRIKRTRQLVHQYVTGERGPGGFPAPACHIGDGCPLWAWREVSYWLWQNGIIRPEEYREAQVVAAINTALEYAHQKGRDPKLVEEVSEAVAAL